MSISRDYYKSTFEYVPRIRKVKHVKFFRSINICDIEHDINSFADDHPEFKILGVRTDVIGSEIIAYVTYLENAKDDCLGEDDCYDGPYEETDSY